MKKGHLIAFDGISACGKGTQIKKLKTKLENMGIEVVVTEWNSDVNVSPVISKAKKKRILYPELWSILHATDFLKRYLEIIIPNINDNKIVIADRYILTALVRDILRGVDEKYVLELYAYALEPALYFWLNIDIKNAYERRKARCEKFYYYSSGCDLYGSVDMEKSWIMYGIKQQEVFNNLKSSNITIVNANLSKDKVHEFIWGKVCEKFNYV